MKYPYSPKSTKKLEVGEFWPIKLKEGKFAYGIILKVLDYSKERRLFLAGLANWVGETEPKEENFKKIPVKIIEYAYCHIKTITNRKEQILGKTIVDNKQLIKIQNENIKNTWGYNFINLKAEKLKNEGSQ